MPRPVLVSWLGHPLLLRWEIPNVILVNQNLEMQKTWTFVTKPPLKLPNIPTAPASQDAGVWWRCLRCQFEIYHDAQSSRKKYDIKHLHLKTAHDTRDFLSDSNQDGLVSLREFPKHRLCSMPVGKINTKPFPNSDGLVLMTSSVILALGDPVARLGSRLSIGVRYANLRFHEMHWCCMGAAWPPTNHLLLRSENVSGKRVSKRPVRPWALSPKRRSPNHN